MSASQQGKIDQALIRRMVVLRVIEKAPSLDARLASASFGTSDPCILLGGHSRPRSPGRPGRSHAFSARFIHILRARRSSSDILDSMKKSYETKSIYAN